MFDRLQPCGQKIIRNFLSIIEQDEHTVNAVVVLRILRPDHDALLAECECHAELREACITDESLAGIELYESVAREDVADVANAEQNAKLFLVEPRAAVFISEIGFPAESLLVLPAGRDFIAECAKLFRVGLHSVYPIERRC